MRVSDFRLGVILAFVLAAFPPSAWAVNLEMLGAAAAADELQEETPVDLSALASVETSDPGELAAIVATEREYDKADPEAPSVTLAGLALAASTMTATCVSCDAGQCVSCSPTSCESCSPASTSKQFGPASAVVQPLPANHEIRFEPVRERRGLFRGGFFKRRGGRACRSGACG